MIVKVIANCWITLQIRYTKENMCVKQIMGMVVTQKQWSSYSYQEEVGQQLNKVLIFNYINRFYYIKLDLYVFLICTMYIFIENRRNLLH